jgi:hypothetical protein
MSLTAPVLEQVDGLFNHIEFHQSTVTLFRILNGVLQIDEDGICGENMT